MMTLGKEATSTRTFFRHFMPKLGNSIEPYQLNDDCSKALASKPTLLGTLLAALVNKESQVLDMLVKQAMLERNYPGFSPGAAFHSCPIMLLHLWMYEDSMNKDIHVAELLAKCPPRKQYSDVPDGASMIDYIMYSLLGRCRPKFPKDLHTCVPSKNALIMNTVGIMTLNRLKIEMRAPHYKKQYAGERFIAFGDILSSKCGDMDFTYVYALDLSQGDGEPSLRQISVNSELRPNDVPLFWPNGRSAHEEDFVE